jgi:signal transduction histidine kinase
LEHKDIPESYCRVFLLDNDGKVIRDFGELEPGPAESLPASSLIGLVEAGRFADFLKTVRAHGAATPEMRIPLASAGGSFLFRGSQTPYGILVFARVASELGDAAPMEEAPGPGPVQDVPDLLANLAHDLKNPISGIIGACQFLGEDGPEKLSAAQLRVLASIESSARKLLQIADGLPRHGGAEPRLSSGGANSGLNREQEKELAAQELGSLQLMVNGIAHDFNNLLGGIVATSELMLELPDDMPTAEPVKSIKAAAMQATKIVRQLQTYAGHGQAALEPVSFSGLVEEMLYLLQVTIPKNASLKTDLAADLPPVMANAAQMRQVILNLVVNAAEALSTEPGVITVRTELEDGSNRHPVSGEAGAADADYIRFEVSDTGRGMTEEIRRQAFDPYFSTKSSGRGLGLTVVQGIVRSHGGVIRVVSEPGKGARFEVLLPYASKPAGGEDLPARANSADRIDASPGSILVVEDEESLRLGVSKMLRKRGFSVIEAGDGCEALEVFRAHESAIRVVLLDLTIPGLTSGEVLAEMRKARPDIKVILTSSYSEEIVGALAGQRTWPFIRKPYQLTDLVAMIQRASKD